MGAPGHEYMEAATTRLLGLLPNLTSCTFEGPLYQDQMTDILQIHSLTRLDIRGEDQNIRRGRPNWMETYPSLVLDFSALASLTYLQSLKIGRLMVVEAFDLAKALTRLALVDLDLSASIWAPRTDPRRRIAGDARGVSPIVAVLTWLTGRFGSLQLPLDVPHLGLPPSLKTLVLADRYHKMVTLTESLPMAKLVEQVTEPCEGLEKLSITFACCHACCLFMKHPLCCHGRSSRWCAFGLGGWVGQWHLDFCKDATDAKEMENPFREPAIIESRRMLAKGPRTLAFTRREGNRSLIYHPNVRKGDGTYAPYGPMGTNAVKSMQ